MANNTRAKRLERWRGDLGRGWPNPNDDSAVRRAAKFLGLEPGRDSDLLLHILADVLFGKAGRPKGSKKWDSSKLLQLAHHHLEVKWHSPKLSAMGAMIEVKKRYPEHYRNTTEEMMRQMLRAARNQYDDWKFEFQHDTEEPPEGWEPPESDWDDDPVE